jgi:hypothetical protein
MEDNTMSKRKYNVRAECPECACGDVTFLGPEKLREKFRHRNQGEIRGRGRLNL